MEQLILDFRGAIRGETNGSFNYSLPLATSDLIKEIQTKRGVHGLFLEVNENKFRLLF
jgi:hypothetical protein